ncbi:MAG: hypothetical protein ACRCW9_03885 [Cetobacterium sp.]
MSLNDYLWNIEIRELQKVSTGSGGYISNWVKVGTFRGLINKKIPNVSYQGGKIVEYSEYKAMGLDHIELKAENRLVYDDYVYRIKGKPKNCIGRNHHVTIELDFVGFDNS